MQDNVRLEVLCDKLRQLTKPQSLRAADSLTRASTIYLLHHTNAYALARTPTSIAINLLGLNWLDIPETLRARDDTCDTLLIIHERHYETAASSSVAVLRLTSSSGMAALSTRVHPTTRPRCSGYPIKGANPVRYQASTPPPRDRMRSSLRGESERPLLGFDLAHLQ